LSEKSKIVDASLIYGVTERHLFLLPHAGYTHRLFT
jgi:hypothetical protein